ncbi:uncharacterized protein LOC142640272 [Castanea sativa]|uniref:uncharacterized protein LOC142640272 n=1 Tax=Castanea sativa TaxID=21020 RepID=UPI003F64EC2D
MELVMFLKNNIDVFAWDPYEAPGVDPSFICHHLNVNPAIVLRRQPPRRSSKEYAEAAKEEVFKLKRAGAIKEVFYLEWLVHTVVVNKKNGTWRVCVDFTDLNKACPKDSFPMPRIDQLVDAIVGHSQMSFLNAFQGTTYQRMITRMFESHLGKTIEVYVDDMVVKSKTVPMHVKDLDDTFQMLKSWHDFVQELPNWKVYVDGVANQRGSGIGLVLLSPEGLIFEKSLRLGFLATNNEAEYEALLVGMDMVQKMGEKLVHMFSDSQLVVGQVLGTLEARDPRMQEYLARVRHLQSRFESFTLAHISRSGNTHADSLATLSTSSAQGLPQVILVEDLLKPARTFINAINIHQVKLGPSWIDPIMSFLKSDILPENRSEADKVHRKASRFGLSENQKLYKRSFSRSYLLCVHPEVTESLLEELHKGICGSHTGGRNLVMDGSSEHMLPGN